MPTRTTIRAFRLTVTDKAKDAILAKLAKQKIQCLDGILFETGKPHVQLGRLVVLPEPEFWRWQGERDARRRSPCRFTIDVGRSSFVTNSPFWPEYCKGVALVEPWGWYYRDDKDPDSTRGHNVRDVCVRFGVGALDKMRRAFMGTFECNKWTLVRVGG